MEEILTLRGIVLSRFRTIGAFANAIKWKRTKASRIINGSQTPNVEDVQSIAECLHIDTQDLFMKIFFNLLSTKWTK